MFCSFCKVKPELSPTGPVYFEIFTKIIKELDFKMQKSKMVQMNHLIIKILLISMLFSCPLHVFAWSGAEIIRSIKRRMFSENGDLFLVQKHSRLIERIQSGDESLEAVIADGNLSDEKIFGLMHVLWERGDKGIFSEYWDIEGLRLIMVDSLKKDHLAGDTELFLRWWDEISSTETGHKKIEEFMTSSFADARVHGSDKFYFTKILKIADDNLFLKTLFSACKEREDVGELVGEIFNRLLIGDGRGVTIRWS